MLILALFTLLTVVALPNMIISPTLYLRTVTLTFFITAAMAFNAINLDAIGTGVSLFNGLYEVSTLTLGTDTFIFLAAGIVLLPWAPWTVSPTTHANVIEPSPINTIHPTVSEYGIIVIFSMVGASLLISSADLVSMYLSIELQSFGVYILATLYRDSLTATDSGLKYFLLGGLSSCFILLGSALLYSYTGLTNIEAIATLFSISDYGTGSLTNGLGVTTLAVIVMMTGYLFKVSAAPFHNWSPDVYDGVPTIVTTWLAVMPKLSILIFVLSTIESLTTNGSGMLGTSLRVESLQSIFLVVSLLSLIIGTIVGLAQARIKRLMAYSTISHVGFIFLALAINSQESIEAYLFYLSQYTITAINSFFVILALGYTVNRTVRPTMDLELIKSFAGLTYLNPLLGLSLAASLFSMAGAPPLIGFFAKQSVLYSAIHTNHVFMAVLGIIVSVISASYYLKVIRVVHFDAMTVEATSSKVDGANITHVHAFIISTLTMVMVLFILNGSLVLDSFTILALNLYSS